MLKLLKVFRPGRCGQELFAVTVLGFLALAGSAIGAVFSVSPSAISNSYGAVLTLQITGLTNGEPVIIQRYLDANSNGVVDAGELLIDAFPVTDGGASTIGGVTNLNVPHDSNPAGGAITTAFSLVGPLDSIIGQQIFRLTSPFGNFSPQTSLLIITNPALAQSISGTIFSGGSPVPNAVAVALAQPNGDLAGAAVADNAGQYLLKLNPGSYAVFPILANHYTDQSIAAQVTLTNGGSATVNLFLTNGSLANTVSGQVSDATNGNPLGGVFLQLESENLFAISFTDSNGNYSAALSPGVWRLRPEADGLARSGYVSPQNRIQVDLTAGSATSVNMPLPKANALFYGRFTNNVGVPFTNIKYFANDQSDEFKAGGFGDANGNYSVAVFVGANEWNCSPDDFDNPGLLGYLISNGLGVTNILAGQAVRQDFIAARAAAQITGNVRDNLGNPVTGVNINGNTIIGGIQYNTSANTDDSGNYFLPAADGTLFVFINCCGNEGLDSYGLFDPAQTHAVTIPPTNAVLNFTVYPVGTPFLSDLARFSSNQFGFNLKGSIGTSYTVEVSTNLSTSNWFNLFSLSLTSNPTYLLDNQATNRQRFYRAKKN